MGAWRGGARRDQPGGMRTEFAPRHGHGEPRSGGGGGSTGAGDAP